NQPIVLGMDKTKFQLRYLGQLLPRGHNLLRSESGNLHKNPVGTLWRNHRFAHAELIDALPNHLDRLIQSVGADRAFTFRGEPNQEGCAALQIKPQSDRFVRWIEHRDAKRDQQDGEDRAQAAFEAGAACREVPTEQASKEIPAKKVNPGVI